MTVRKVSEITGVSVRTLRYYDSIGLLKATCVTEAGYRLYDGAALEKLGCILLFRELEFSLREIKDILDSPGFDRRRSFEQQITLLEMRRERLRELISLAREQLEENNMSFEAFDRGSIDKYAAQAKASWGHTAEYAESERRDASRSDGERQALTAEMADIFRRFGELKAESPDCTEANALVRELQNHITENYYKCTDEILRSLGEMYADGGDFTANIDYCGGEGTALFAKRAIEAALA